MDPNKPPGSTSQDTLAAISGDPESLSEELTRANIRLKETNRQLKDSFEEIKDSLELFYKKFGEGSVQFTLDLDKVFDTIKKVKGRTEEFNNTIAEGASQIGDYSAKAKAYFENLQNSIKVNEDISAAINATIKKNFEEIKKTNEEIAKNAQGAAESLQKFKESVGIGLDLEGEELEKKIKEEAKAIEEKINLKREEQEKILEIDKKINQQKINLETAKSENDKKYAENYINKYTQQQERLSSIKKKMSAEEESKLRDFLLIELGLTEEKANEVVRLKKEELEETEKYHNYAIVAEQTNREAVVQTTEAANKKLAALRALKEVESIQEKNTIALSKSMEGLLNKITGVNAQTNAFGSAIISMTSKTNLFSKGIKEGFIDAFLSPEASIMRFTNFLNKNLIQSSFEYDKIISDMNKKTGGFGKEFDRVAYNTSGGFIKTSAAAGLASYGIGLQELSESYDSLNKKILSFNQMSDDQKRALSINAAELSKLGMSASDYGDLMNKFMGGVGKTADGAKSEINRLAREAIAAGRNVGEYAATFKSLSASLTGFGRESVQIFKELAGMAQAMKNVSEQDLVNLGESFSTFEGASDAVSKLNVALRGTHLNMMDLMTADPSERIMKIKQAYLNSGQDFDKLNIGYKRAVAEALGFGKDVEKAGAFLRADMAEMQLNMYRAAASEKEREERIKRSTSAQEKLTKAMEGMKIALTPVIDFLGLIGDGIDFMNKHVGGFLTFLTVGIGLAAAAIKGAMFLAGAAGKAAVAGITQTLTTELSTINLAVDRTMGKFTALAEQAAAARAAAIAASAGAVPTAGVVPPIAAPPPTVPTGTPPPATGAPGFWTSGRAIGLAAIGLMIVGGVAAGLSKKEYNRINGKTKEERAKEQQDGTESQQTTPPAVVVPGQDVKVNKQGKVIQEPKDSLGKQINNIYNNSRSALEKRMFITQGENGQPNVIKPIPEDFAFMTIPNEVSKKYSTNKYTTQNNNMPQYLKYTNFSSPVIGGTSSFSGMSQNFDVTSQVDNSLIDSRKIIQNGLTLQESTKIPKFTQKEKFFSQSSGTSEYKVLLEKLKTFEKQKEFFSSELKDKQTINGTQEKIIEKIVKELKTTEQKDMNKFAEKIGSEVDRAFRRNPLSVTSVVQMDGNVIANKTAEILNTKYS